ncbi:response regulator [Peribacillus asahii]|uniref:response regulator n=1 Tax=Peribacillus asahii TaxID=228899 RepID=UPI002079DDCF|nr:response regulator transcription factor [Peribacillus asahii]USK68598.1 response regulator transcription factor [Peribacillus asahii]
MIRIVIAEDQEMLLGVIGSLLDLEEDMEVVGQARNGEEALTLVHQLQPDVCIMDIEMPEMSGLEAADVLMSTECKVIILTTFARTGYFKRVLKAGVRGYLLKDSPSEELVCSIRSIMDGKQIYSPELIDDNSSDNEQEIPVSELVDDGQITNELSNQRSNTVGTVINYFSTVMNKMKLPTG